MSKRERQEQRGWREKGGVGPCIARLVLIVGGACIGKRASFHILT
jgi:hypothetical protein